jgi:hypothetical protein
MIASDIEGGIELVDTIGNKDKCIASLIGSFNGFIKALF